MKTKDYMEMIARALHCCFVCFQHPPGRTQVLHQRAEDDRKDFLAPCRWNVTRMNKHEMLGGLVKCVVIKRIDDSSD
jgi:hypothetical protein